MKELDLHTEIVKAVVAGGGYGLKVSHRFYAGVPDLLLRPPGCPAMLIEVKLCQTVSPKRVTLDLTTSQFRHLRDAQAGGLLAGVLSFWGQKPSKLRAAVIDVPSLSEMSKPWSAPVELYTPCLISRGVCGLLKQFAQEGT